MKTTPKQTAYVLLRITMGVNLLAHGLVRFPKLYGFRDWMVDFFKDTPFPNALVSVWATVLPFVEFGIGLLLILGLYTYKTSIAGALLIIILLFGSCMTEQWEWAGMQLIYALIFGILISQIENNDWSINNILNKQK
jgi:thiosulfate dehydrogenase (quinone) large subunit